MKNESHETRNVINPAQLIRIEAVHRGFLYQHLYSTACLLRLMSLERGAVLIERDEDVEIDTDDTVYFLQIKTRKVDFQPHHLTGVLEHFVTLKEKHKDNIGEREVVFCVIANRPAEPTLETEIKSWPDDVKFMCPETSTDDLGFLPKAGADLNEAILIATELVEQVPLRSLQPDTIVWKLAAQIQFAATGEDPERPAHRFDRSQMPDLLELFTSQLQAFPALSEEYRPQIDEPALVSDERVRILQGFSGAGKTLWASTQAHHSSGAIIYFDVGDLPDPAIASSLAREVAARIVSGGSANSARLPAGSGFELLTAINQRIDMAECPIVVLDNAHRIAPNTIQNIINRCGAISFILLSQPGEHIGEFEGLLGTKAMWLNGWDIDTIAEVFAESGAVISPVDARHWREITAGLPLYVINAARLCRDVYGGNSNSFLHDLETRNHAEVSMQEMVLQRTLKSLSDIQMKVLAALSLTHVRLTVNEISQLIAGLNLEPNNPIRILRRLSQLGFVQRYTNGEWKVHDAIRLPAKNFFETISPTYHQTCLAALRDIFRRSLQERQDIVRLSAWVRLLAPTGQADTLVELASQEFFHQILDTSDLKAIIEDLASKPNLEPSEEFWALESLAFWDLQSDPRLYDVRPRLERMSELIEKHPEIDKEGPLIIALKILIAAGLHDDLAAVNIAYQNSMSLAGQSKILQRIVRYNYAAALCSVGEYRKSLVLSEGLVSEYYDLLDIKRTDVLGANPEGMRKLIKGKLGDVQDDLKHLADSLSLTAKCCRALNEQPFLRELHAAKFFQLANARLSEMKAAQDFADDSFKMGDTEGAVMVMENYALPLLQAFQFDGQHVDIISHYAILLAYNGKIDAARQQMLRLVPFLADLPDIYREGVAGQRRLIEQIARGEISAPHRIIPPPALVKPRARPIWKQKIKVNAPCPCGSGKKYKKCCLSKV